MKNVGGAAKTVVTPQKQEEDDDDEYNPLPISGAIHVSTEAYKPRPTSPSTRAFLLAQEQNKEEIPFLSATSSTVPPVIGASKLSHMTDAELMSLVPDGVDLAPPPAAGSKVLDMPPGLGDGNDEEYDPGQ